MVPLNDFLEANTSKMVAYLELVATDPVSPESECFSLFWI